MERATGSRESYEKCGTWNSSKYPDCEYVFEELATHARTISFEVLRGAGFSRLNLRCSVLAHRDVSQFNDGAAR